MATNNIAQNSYELQQRMGSMATDEETDAMIRLLKQRGIETFEQLNEMPEKEFFALIADAVAIADEEAEEEDGEGYDRFYPVGY